MARRSRLPGADELFRATAGPTVAEPAVASAPRTEPAAQSSVVESPPPGDGAPRSREELAPRPATALRPATRGSGLERPRPTSKGVRRVTRARADSPTHSPSGREKHEEKITVYVSHQELLDLERARWILRAEHGLASDRGRIVREAVAVVLADLEAKGASSILVSRLQELEG